MPQVKLYGRSETVVDRRDLWMTAINEGFAAVLAIAPEKIAYLCLVLDAHTLYPPGTQPPDYTVVEITLFAGRDRAQKHQLIDTIFAAIHQKLGLSGDRVEILLRELPPENWGLLGTTGDRLPGPPKPPTA